MRWIAILIFSFIFSSPIFAQDLRVTTDGAFVIVGDQWINKDQFEQSEKSLKSPYDPISTRGSKPAKVELWEDGVLPIEFKKDVEPFLQERVLQACNEWASHANIKCQKGKYKNRVLTISRAYMGNRSGCFSMLGSDYYFMSIRRRMNLGDGCEHYSTVLHELGHAFGLTHEHQRADRDDYVDILEENVDKQFMGFGLKLNFSKHDGELYTPYDFLSIMHYDQYAFSKNDLKTILLKEKFKNMQDRIGNSNTLSEYDIKSIQLMYGPMNLRR
jgi:hypothetical protein